MGQFKVHILFEFVDGPWGGGNQFLRTLRKYFEHKNLYESDPTKADAILFNSHHCLKEVLSIKKNYPVKIFIHRIDGPIFSVRGKDKGLDKLIFMINYFVADGTVFQSMWSRQRCYERGMAQSKYEETSLNAPDPDIFYPKDRGLLENQKIKLIATSWSSNLKKGFDIYEYLDENLDFNRYEMTFVGNSPIKFHKINHLEPMPSSQLAKELRKHDIFITASLDDPCSNSLIEALHCGLPAVVRNSGGHPEIIGNAGVFFEGTSDVCSAIDKVADKYSDYVQKLRPQSMNEIGDMYLNLIKQIWKEKANNVYSPKKLTLLQFTKLMLSFEFNRVASRLKYCFATRTTN